VNRRAFVFWLLLSLCAAMVFGAMLWLTHGVREAGLARWNADCERAAAEARADIEERTRLALWRMDTLASSMILREERMVDRLFVENPNGAAAMVPPPEVRLYFQIVNGGKPIAPEVGDKSQASRLAELARHLSGHPLAVTDAPPDSAVPQETSLHEPSPEILQQEGALALNSSRRKNESAQELRKDADYQLQSNFAEKAVRWRALDQNALGRQAANATQAAKPAVESHGDELVQSAAASPPVVHRREIGPLRAVWSGDELFLLRRANLLDADGRVIEQRLQGCWMDVAALRSGLLGSVADLFAGASLPPVAATATADPLALVSLPFTLVRGESPAIQLPPRPRFGLPLVLAWAGVGIAFLTTAALVIGLMRLSERRASFVSAVTHELRTPLTTFRLYSDMLEQGALKPEKQAGYLRVLSREADRLSHLVENVLAFSRIERGSARSHVSETTIDRFFESQRERWSARLATAGLDLLVHPAPGLSLRTDLNALEHILFNLIDNAAKYAAGSDPPQVEISARAENGSLVIEVADHGPGIAAEDHRRIFRPFHKSAREAADTQPGVGLGLALSRRLAANLGGSLTLANDLSAGARFLLRLPALQARS
jgi:signal transduction histidine kinase